MRGTSCKVTRRSDVLLTGIGNTSSLSVKVSIFNNVMLNFNKVMLNFKNVVLNFSTVYNRVFGVILLSD